MTKYVVAVLVFIAALMGLLIYVGDASQLVVTSTSPRAPLIFEGQFSWRFIVTTLTIGLILLCVLWSFLGWLMRLPGRFKSGAGLRKRAQALEAMEDALIAGAEGDAQKARKKSERARALINSAALGRIVSAQAAEACGDSTEAIAHYSAMLEDSKTLATGQRGLAQQMLASGDLSGAIEHAGQGYRDNKNARWAFDVLFQAQVADYRWADAVETLDTAVSRKHIASDIASRRRVVLLTAMADRANDAGDSATALATVLSAVKEVNDFAPAVSLAATLYKAEGQDKKAISLIEKAWDSAPHPALSLVYQDMFAGQNDKVIAKKIETLIKRNPNHRESQLLRAEDALRRKDGVLALSTLSPLLEVDPVTARLCMLVYTAEKLLANPTDAHIWLERAATAPSEPDWTDLDPQGEAFEYTNRDWRRLVFSYGETGGLIHPRFESGAATRAFLPVSTQDPDVLPEKTSEPLAEKVDSSRQPDDPGIAGKVDTSDLAERLDSLLDNSSKP